MRIAPALLALALCISTTTAAPKYAIAIHGGAGSSEKAFSAEENAARRDALKTALAAGEAVLSRGGSAVDAVEAAIVIMEDEPLFNAGRGAVLNQKGRAELDASIMDGETRACGAVAGITVARNPISVARAVMEKTKHVLLGGAGADEFAGEIGARRVPREYFITERQKARWDKAMKAEPTVKPAKPIGTVGCVALDSEGRLAAGTSTGGLMLKKFGRIGDSPIVGAGTYADSKTCAVSCTGVGEEFIRNAIAYDIYASMQYGGADLESAVGKQLTEVLKPGYGGIIAIDPGGKIVMQYNTAGMACAAADSEGRFEIRWGADGEK